MVHGLSTSFLINFQIQEIHSSQFWNAGKLTEELQRAGKAKAFKIVADELIRGSKKQLNLCADNLTTVSGMYKHSTFFSFFFFNFFLFSLLSQHASQLSPHLKVGDKAHKGTKD